MNPFTLPRWFSNLRKLNLWMVIFILAGLLGINNPQHVMASAINPAPKQAHILEMAAPKGPWIDQAALSAHLSSLLHSILAPDCTIDLAITKTDGKTQVLSGSTTIYTIVVTNNGPSYDGNNSVFKDPVVTGLTVTDVKCDSHANGAACPDSSNTNVSLMQTTGIIIPTLPIGGIVTFKVTATVKATSGSVTNTATITPPSGRDDTKLGNNTDSDTDTVIPAVDLAITNTDGVTSVLSGSGTTYTIVATNNGPSGANGAIFTNPTAAGLSFTTVTCGSAAGGAVCPAAGDTTLALMTGSGIIIPTFPKGGSVTFSLTALVTAASGSVTDTANITAPAGITETNLTNNTASDTDTIIPLSQVDLAITNTDGVTSVNPGTLSTYTIVVTNNGPSAADGSIFTNPTASGLLFTQVKCGSAAGGAICPAEINTTLTLMTGAGIIIPTFPNGGSVTFSLTALVTATSGSVTDTANITAPTGEIDTNLANNSDSDTDTITPNPLTIDLAITNTDGVTIVNPGNLSIYTIVVTNNGPSAGDGAIFTNPAAFGLNNIAISCGLPTGGAACPTTAKTTVALMQGAGIIIPTLPSGGSVTFTLSALVTAPSGSVTDTAIITAPAGQTDTNPSNNVASDTDTIRPAELTVDLAITKTDGVTSVKPGSTAIYTIVVTNNGPMAADGAIFTDPPAIGLTATDVSCASALGGAACPTAANTTLALLQGGGIIIPVLPSGGSVTFTLTATVTETDGSVTETAIIATPPGEADVNPATNIATDIDTIIPSVDLAITITDGVTTVATGSQVIYTVVATNNGPSGSNGAVFANPAVGGLEVTAVSCGSPTGGAVCPDASTTTVALMQGAGIVIPIFPVEGSVTFTVTATVTSGPGSITDTALIATPVGITDTNLANNCASDTDVIPAVIYKIYIPFMAKPQEVIVNPTWGVGLGFEDLPLVNGQNDFDYNDWAVDINGSVGYVPSTNLMQTIAMGFLPKTRGAAYDHKFQIVIPANGFASDGTAVLTLSDKNHQVLNTQTIRFIANQDNLFVIFPKTSDVFPGSQVDTFEAKAYVEPQRFANLAITFDTPFAYVVSTDDLSSPHGGNLFFDPGLFVINTSELVHRGDLRLVVVPSAGWLWPEEGVRIDTAYPLVTFTASNPPLFTFPALWWTDFNHCVYDGVPCRAP